jgi:hypothetical protein
VSSKEGRHDSNYPPTFYRSFFRTEVIVNQGLTKGVVVKASIHKRRNESILDKLVDAVASISRVARL